MSIAMKAAAIQLIIVMMLVIAAGCARRDWIESMLVTVDVTGTWAGVWTRGQGGVSVGTGQAEVTLQQVGPNITGWITVISGGRSWALPGLGSLPQNAQPQGTVNGDVVRLSGPGVEIELTVNGEQMSGTSTGPGTGAIDLRRVGPGGREATP